MAHYWIEWLDGSLIAECEAESDKSACNYAENRVTGLGLEHGTYRIRRKGTTETATQTIDRECAGPLSRARIVAPARKPLYRKIGGIHWIALGRWRISVCRTRATAPAPRPVRLAPLVIAAAVAACVPSGTWSDTDARPDSTSVLVGE